MRTIFGGKPAARSRASKSGRSARLSVDHATATSAGSMATAFARAAGAGAAAPFVEGGADESTARKYALVAAGRSVNAATRPTLIATEVTIATRENFTRQI